MTSQSLVLNLDPPLWDSGIPSNVLSTAQGSIPHLVRACQTAALSPGLTSGEQSPVRAVNGSSLLPLGKPHLTRQCCMRPAVCPSERHSEESEVGHQEEQPRAERLVSVSFL